MSGTAAAFRAQRGKPGSRGSGASERGNPADSGQPGLKIPHMGWNSLKLKNDGRLFSGIGEEPYVYFVHSYYLKAAEEEIVTATADYTTTIHAP